MRLGCVIMACGQGRRFRAAGGSGQKLLADVLGMPLVARTASSVPRDLFEVVLSVADPQVADAARACDEPFGVARAEVPEPPRSLAVRCGLQAGLDRWDGCLFLPGDQPLVTRASFTALARAFSADPTRAYRLSWQGSPASPVLFPRSCFGGLMRLEGKDGGGSLIRGGAVDVACVEAATASELLDVDTPADLSRIIEALRGERG